MPSLPRMRRGGKGFTRMQETRYIADTYVCVVIDTTTWKQKGADQEATGAATTGVAAAGAVCVGTA
jgi:hypothetical protein